MKNDFPLHQFNKKVQNESSTAASKEKLKVLWKEMKTWQRFAVLIESRIHGLPIKCHMGSTVAKCRNVSDEISFLAQTAM